MFFFIIFVSDPIILKFPTIPYFISERAQIWFPLPIFVLVMYDLMPNMLQLPILIMLSFYEVGLNIITALSSMTLQSPKTILKCQSFFSQIMEHVGLIIQPQPKMTLPTISFNPKFRVFIFFIIQYQIINICRITFQKYLQSQQNPLLLQLFRLFFYFSIKIFNLQRMLDQLLKSHISKQQPQINNQISDGKRQFGKYFQPLEHNANELKGLKEIRFNNYLLKSEFIQGNNIEGYTIVYLNDKMIYEGQFRRSKRNGYGIQYDEQKKSIKYEGYFRDDKYDGWGRTPVYSGQYRDGLYDGYGIQTTGKTYYEGFFHKGLPNGQGVSFKGEKMESFHPVKNIIDFLMQGMKNNMDIFKKYNIEEIYLGQWKEGFKHGFGRLFKLNYWYSGQFSNDLPHGLGAQQTKTQKQSKVTQTVYRLGVKK